MRDLMPALVDAEKEVHQALTEWLAEAKDGDKRFTAHEYRRVLAQLRKARKAGKEQWRREEPEWTERLEYNLERSLRRSAKGSAALAAGHVEDELATFSTVFGEALGPIPIDTAAIMARGERALVPRFRTSAKRYGAGVWGDIKHQFAVGMVRNETIDQLTNRLQRLGGPKGRVALVGVKGEPGSRVESISEGLFARYRHWAERVVRTETINAYNVQADETLSEAHSIDPEIQRRWDASLDSRLCAQCQSLHGVIVEENEDFPGGIRHPPAHAQCRCAVVAWHKEWDQDELGDTDRELEEYHRKPERKLAQGEKEQKKIEQQEAKDRAAQERARKREEVRLRKIYREADKLSPSQLQDLEEFRRGKLKSPEAMAVLREHGMVTKYKGSMVLTKLGRDVLGATEEQRELNKKLLEQEQKRREQRNRQRSERRKKQREQARKERERQAALEAKHQAIRQRLEAERKREEERQRKILEFVHKPSARQRAERARKRRERRQAKKKR